MLFYSLYALIGLFTGVCVLYNLSGAGLAATAVAAAVTVLIFSVKKFRGFLLPCLVFVMFAALGTVRMREESRISPYTEEFVTLTGRISEIPYKSESSWCYTLDCQNLTYARTKSKFNDRVLFYSENEYSLDDNVCVSGFLELNEGAKNPGCFNAYAYYRSVGVSYKISAYEDSLKKQNLRDNSVYAHAVRTRSKICDTAEEHFQANNAVILKYILAGFKKELDRDYSSTLLNSGVLRSLYSPYCHLTFILLIIGLLLKGVPTSVRRIAICVSCVLYLRINPYSPVAEKLFLFTLVTELLKFKVKMVRRQDVLWAVVIFCGLKNPYVFYNEGFLVSVTATAFMTVFFYEVYKRISWINTNGGFIRIIALCIISCFALLPVAAYFFEGTALYSVLLSVILMPVIFAIYTAFAVMCILLKLNLGTGIVEVFIENLTAFVRNIPVLVEKLPFSYVIVPRMPLALLAGYLVFLAAIYKKRYKKTFYTLLSICVGLTLSFGMGEAMRACGYTVTFLNVGQGDCTLTDMPYKCTVLVDGGGSAEYNTTYDVGTRDVFPYLRHNNIFKLDYVFVSHYHKDHADGILSLMDCVKINNIFLPDCLPKNEYRVMIEERARKKKINVRYISQPQKIKLKGGATAEILYFDGNADNENDTSVVMRIENKGIGVLYTGDITAEAEEKILASGTDVSADILKVAHHSSGGSNSREFLQEVKPSFAVAMLAKNNRYGFPAKETVKSMEALDIPFLTTAEEGCIQFTITNRRLTWQRKNR